MKSLKKSKPISSLPHSTQRLGVLNSVSIFYHHWQGLIDTLEACEMWFLRKIGRISCKERKTNEEVLALFDTERKLINKIKSSKMTFLDTSRDMIQS